MAGTLGAAWADVDINNAGGNDRRGRRGLRRSSQKRTYDPKYGACEPKAGCVNAAIFAYSPRF